MQNPVLFHIIKIPPYGGRSLRLERCFPANLINIKTCHKLFLLSPRDIGANLEDEINILTTSMPSYFVFSLINFKKRFD